MDSLPIKNLVVVHHKNRNGCIRQSVAFTSRTRRRRDFQKSATNPHDDKSDISGVLLQCDVIT
jgi:hypothetical protein